MSRHEEAQATNAFEAAREAIAAEHAKLAAGLGRLMLAYGGPPPSEAELTGIGRAAGTPMECRDDRIHRLMCEAVKGADMVPISSHTVCVTWGGKDGAVDLLTYGAARKGDTYEPRLVRLSSKLEGCRDADTHAGPAVQVRQSTLLNHAAHDPGSIWGMVARLAFDLPRWTPPGMAERTTPSGA